MTFAEVAPGIHRPMAGVVNWYLVEDGGGLALVDAGAPKDWPALVQALSSMGRTLSDLDAVLLTHAHTDHTGMAEHARKDAGATVRIHEADVPVARGAKPGKNERGIGGYLLKAEAWRTTLSLTRRGAIKAVPILEVSSFADGERLDAPGRPRVVLCPGHTPGCCALLFEEKDVLCSGDTIATRNPMTGRVGPQIMPGVLNRDSKQALESLSALEGITASMLLPGHGEPWTGGVAEAVRLARLAGPS